MRISVCRGVLSLAGLLAAAAAAIAAPETASPASTSAIGSDGSAIVEPIKRVRPSETPPIIPPYEKQATKNAAENTTREKPSVKQSAAAPKAHKTKAAKAASKTKTYASRKTKSFLKASASR